jgi:hypothetical protein
VIPATINTRKQTQFYIGQGSGVQQFRLPACEQMELHWKESACACAEITCHLINTKVKGLECSYCGGKQITWRLISTEPRPRAEQSLKTTGIVLNIQQLDSTMLIQDVPLVILKSDLPFLKYPRIFTKTLSGPGDIVVTEHLDFVKPAAYQRYVNGERAPVTTLPVEVFKTGQNPREKFPRARVMPDGSFLLLKPTDAELNLAREICEQVSGSLGDAVKNATSGASRWRMKS